MSPNPADASLLARLRRVLDIEAKAISGLSAQLTPAAAEAVRRIVALKGRLVVTGMGKSGHVARKLAATFASTGKPAFFVHPAEAQHGGLGMIQSQDLVLALSYSGETDELRLIAPHLKRMGTTLVAMTGTPSRPWPDLQTSTSMRRCKKRPAPLTLPRPRAPQRHWRLETHWPLRF